MLLMFPIIWYTLNLQIGIFHSFKFFDQRLFHNIINTLKYFATTPFVNFIFFELHFLYILLIMSCQHFRQLFLRKMNTVVMAWDYAFK